MGGIQAVDGGESPASTRTEVEDDEGDSSHPPDQDSETSPYYPWGETLEEGEQGLALTFASSHRGKNLDKLLTWWHIPGGLPVSSPPLKQLGPNGDGSLPLNELEELNALADKYKERLAAYKEPLDELILLAVQQAFENGKVTRTPGDTYSRHSSGSRWEVSSGMLMGGSAYSISLDLRDQPEIGLLIEEVERIQKERWLALSALYWR